MTRGLWIFCFFVLVCATSFSQAAVGEPSSEKIGTDTAQQYLRKISIAKFEDASFWKAAIPRDQGNITWRRLPGRPAEKAERDKDRLEAEKQLAVPIPEGGYVLGVRVDFYKRGMNQIHIVPIRPIPIPGICKTISVWVVGRSFKHRLVMLKGVSHLFAIEKLPTLNIIESNHLISVQTFESVLLDILY